MIAKSVVVSVVTQHQQSLPARTSLLLLCRVSIHYFNSKKYPFGRGGGVQKNLCHLGFFKVCFFFFLFFSRLEMHFFLLLLLCFFLCVFQKLFFFIFFSLSLLYKSCAKHVRPSVPPTHTLTFACWCCVFVFGRKKRLLEETTTNEKKKKEQTLLFFFFEQQQRER